MNNLQLSILLDKYSDLLWTALASIEGELPDELKEVATVGVHLLTKEEQVYAPVMQPLRDVLFDIGNDTELLRKSGAKQ